MTKKQEQMYNSYKYAMRNQKTELREVYGSYSRKKEEAMNYCKALQNRLGGYSGTIVGAATYFFSYAFRYWDADTKKECLCYCTHANDYKFPLD